MSVPLFLWTIMPEVRLFADDGDFCVGNFEAHQAVIAVEQKENLQVGGVDLEAFVGFALGAGRSSGLHGDSAGSQFLGNENRASLHAALRPGVDARQDSGLMIENVVQHSE